MTAAVVWVVVGEGPLLSWQCPLLAGALTAVSPAAPRNREAVQQPRDINSVCRSSSERRGAVKGKRDTKHRYTHLIDFKQSAL